MGYVWVRECERKKSQHYHCVLYLDGHVIQHPAKLRQLIADTWAALAGIRADDGKPWNHVYFPANGHYDIAGGASGAETKADLIYRVSYMAKTRGKGYRKPTANDFSSSNLAIQ